MENYYTLLGVSKEASQIEIKKKFRQKQFQYDANKEKTFDVLNKHNKLCEAYKTLSDEKLKAQYDLSINKEIIIQETIIDTPMNNNKAVDMLSVIGEQLLTNVMKNMSNLENQPNIPFNLQSSLPILQHTQTNLSSIQDTISNDPILIPPIIKTFPITYIQAYNGCILPLEIERKIYSNEMLTSHSTEKETIYINIPKGIDNNEMLFFSNKGDVVGNNYGELKVNIILKEHDVFRRDGINLIYTKELTLKEALCGCTFNIEHLNNKSFKISTFGNVISYINEQIIPSMGFQRVDCSPAGDLVIKFKILFPEKLSKESIDALSNLLP